MSVRSVRKRKKGRIDVIDREGYGWRHPVLDSAGVDAHRGIVTRVRYARKESDRNCTPSWEQPRDGRWPAAVPTRRHVRRMNDLLLRRVRMGYAAAVQSTVSLTSAVGGQQRISRA